MDALSALNMMSSAGALNRALPGGAAGGKSISPADMAELTSSLGGTGLNLDSFRANRTATAKLPVDNLSIQETTPLDRPDSTAIAGNSPTGSFSSLLGKVVGEVNEKQNAASESVQGLLSGKNVSVHQAMIAMEEANLSFHLMVQVRNKLLDSYQELMRMQV